MVFAFAIILAVLVALVVGFVAARLFTRQLRQHSELEREATVAATRAALDEAVAGRDFVMQAAVETVVSVAGDKLRDQLKAGSSEFDLRSQAFDQRVASMNDELHRLGELVSTLQRERASQHGQLVEGLEQAARTHAALADTTSELRQALASPKARGQWGERMADDVLRHAGMVEGINYRKQKALAGGTIPDFTFLMPQGLELNMDVKFPVDNYLRHLGATSDTEGGAHLKAFVRDVRQRLKEITTRDYIDAETTVDCVLLFIPNESIYSFIHEHDPALVDLALEQRVMLCSPFTLFAVLGVIRRAVDNFVLQRTSDEILECLTGFGKEWGKFTDQLDKVGRQFDSAQKSLEALSTTRRRALDRRLEQIEDLRNRRELSDLDSTPGELHVVREFHAG